VLGYRWRVPGRILAVENDAFAADGRVLARYRGAYAWDAGRGEVVFWTAAESGEVHRGRAWWADGVLWHEADVSGGSAAAYASAVRPRDGRIEYFAAYGQRDARAALLETEPLVYARARAASDGGALQSLAFLAGCWRGESLEEFFTAPAPDLMLGVSRFMRDGRVVQHEFSRITADSIGIVLLPFPGGHPSAQPFRLTRVGDGDALFEAPAHDFPRRIRYTLGVDGALTARIDGGEGDARVREWRMPPASCTPDPGPGADR
jgi:hypothetical protein